MFLPLLLKKGIADLNDRDITHGFTGHPFDSIFRPTHPQPMKSEMADRVHPVTVHEIDPSELARLTSRLRYDALLVFLRELERNLAKDAQSDRGRGRTQLAELLDNAAAAVTPLRDEIAKAWRLSKPFMNDELRVLPEILPRQTGGD